MPASVRAAAISSEQAVFSVRLFGPTTVVVGGSPVGLGPHKRRAVLAALALSAGHVVSVDRLVDMVWGDDPPGSARNAVQVYMTALRKALPAGAIRTQEPGYVLDCPTECVDVLRFEQLVNDHADDALALWTGAPLADLTDLAFAETVATRLTELRLQALENRIDRELERGRHDDLIPEVEAILLEAPYRERLWRQLMLCCYRSGRQADALDAFQRARQLLDDQLGIEPGPALVALERAILVQDPELAAPAADDGPVFAPLPRILTATVGRETLLDEAAALVAEHRLVTLLGPGGVGKTRTAQELAHRMIGDYPDGVVFADLSRVRDAASARSELARALGASGDDDDATAVDDAVQGRRILLVLDNLEQITDAPDLVGRLLAADGPRVIVTTRIALGIVAERVVPVAPLDWDDSLTMLADRIVAAGGAGAEPAVVEQLAASVDGLPLAIELVAASCRSVGPQAVLDLVTRQVPLPAGLRDMPERQQTMRALIDWSLELLDPDERALLDVLTEFAGPFSMDAARALADVPADAPAVLGRLVESSLVVRDGETFRLLQPVREQLLALMPDVLADALHERHTTWVIALTTAAGHDLYAGDEEATRARVQAVLPDIRLAFERLVGEGRHEEAARVVLDVVRVWFLAGRLREVSDALTRVSGHDRLTPGTAAEVSAVRGIFARLTGDSEAGGELLRMGLPGLREYAPNSIALVNSLCHYADDRLAHEQPAEAVALANEAVAAARRTQDIGSLSMALDLAGYVARGLGDDEWAVAAAREAVDVARRGERSGLADAIAGLAVSLGPDDPEGVALAWESIAVAESVGLPHQLARVALTVVDVIAPDDPAATATLMAQALATYLAIGHQVDVEITLVLATIAAPTDPESAARLLGAARRRADGGPVGEPGAAAELEARLVETLGRGRFAKAMGQGAALGDDDLGRLGEAVAQRLSGS